MKFCAAFIICPLIYCPSYSVEFRYTMAKCILFLAFSLSLSHIQFGVFFMWKTFSHCVNITTIKLDWVRCCTHSHKTSWFMLRKQFGYFSRSTMKPFFFHMCVSIVFWLNSIRSIPRCFILVNSCTRKSPVLYAFFVWNCFQQNNKKWMNEQFNGVYRVEFSDCL